MLRVVSDEQGIDELGSLLRAADLIGQLGDPHYLRKANALYYEFEEIGLNRQFGYESPADRRPFTATYFVPSVSYAIRGHSRDAADVCYWH